MAVRHAYTWLAYSAHEVANFVFLVWLCIFAVPSGTLKSLPYPLFALLAYVAFHCCFLLYAFVQVLIRRLFRPSFRVDTTKVQHKPPVFESSTHKTRDGIELKVQVARSKSSSKVMLLACPLGQCGPAIFSPIMCWFGPEFTYVTWDYRGFFNSAKPNRIRRISIPEHAQDAIEVLEACGYKKADVMVGHSMGTAVSFETVLLFPEKIGAIIILNGFHGQVFRTAFQPIWRLPLVGDFMGGFVNFMMKNPQYMDHGRLALRPIFDVVLPIYARLLGSRMMKQISGDRYLVDFFENYFGRICESRKSYESYAQLFQELDAHSVYHLLPGITQPVLLISGLFDFVTPAMQSFEIERQIPQAEHYCDPFSGHATILESPEWCVAEIDVFLRCHVLNSGSSTKGKKTQ